MIKKKIVRRRIRGEQAPKKKKTSRFLIAAGLLLPVLMLTFIVMWYTSYSSREPAAVQMAPLPPGSAPEIVSARIRPDNPNSTTGLSVEYQVRESEGTPGQYTFRWYVEGSILQEGASSALEPGSAKKGETVVVEIIPSNVHGQGRIFKSEPVQIANQPPVVTSLSVSPSEPVPGEMLAATAAAEDADHDEIRFRYVWTVNGEPVANLPPESSTFDTRQFRKKDNVSVTVTPTDGENDGQPVLSEIIALVNSAPRIISKPPTDLRGGVYSYQVAASDPDGDKIAYSLPEAPEGMAIDPASGLIRWEPPKEVPERREIAVKITADDGDGGSSSQEYSLFLEEQ